MLTATANALAPDIARYRLFYDQEDTDEFVEVELKPSQCSYHATGLVPNAVYRFQVAAFSPGGDGPETPVLRYRLAEGRIAHDESKATATISRRRSSEGAAAAADGSDAAASAFERSKLASLRSREAVTGSGTAYTALKLASLPESATRTIPSPEAPVPARAVPPEGRPQVVTIPFFACAFAYETKPWNPTCSIIVMCAPAR